MEKTKQQLIADFKKANKERRQKIAEKNGFTTPEQYLAFLGKATKKAIKKVKTRISAPKVKLDYVVAFDTTGSMSAYINNVKAHVEKLIPEMFSQNIDLRMKIVAFGDYCDMSNRGKTFGNAYQESPFTDDEQVLKNFVKNAKNTNGGDGDEFYELVIKKITEETPWREGATKTVLLIADADPHPVGYYIWDNSYNIDWRQEAQKAAKLNISFDTLSIHGDRFSWYKELSTITNGVNMPFQSSNKMSEVVTAAAYVRGSETSKAVFMSSMSAAVDSGDTELIGTYKSLSTLL